MSFRWVIKYSALEWRNITPNQSGETITLTSESDPGFDSFVPIITDGVDLEIGELVLWDTSSGTGWGMERNIDFESDMFRNQPGCQNGIDLEGNLIEGISLSVLFGTRFSEECPRNETIPFYNLTIRVLGRSLMRDENALAVIAYRGLDHSCRRTGTISLQVIEELNWAVMEFIVELDKIQVNDTLVSHRAYGMHPIEQLLTNGIDGQISVCSEGLWSAGGGCSSPVPSNESVVLKDEPGFTGVDLQGCYVNNITLFVSERSELDPTSRCSIWPEFVISGSLGEPPPFPDCEPCSECGLNGISGSNGIFVNILVNVLSLLAAAAAWLAV